MGEERTVHIVDDDDGIRDSLSAMLQACGYRCQLHPSALSLLAADAKALTGCAILDVRMPGMDGLALQRELLRRDIRLPVIFMTGFADVPLAVSAMRAGAVDFVEKPCALPKLREVIDRALGTAATLPSGSQATGDLQMRFERLTSRERDVLNCVIAGHPNKITAYKLGISARTVEIHRARVMEKTQARSLSELVRMAMAANVP